MGRESKPYATMKDGPDAYLFRKDGKQKLVGSADKETCPDCDGSGYVPDSIDSYYGEEECHLCDGTGEVQPLEEDDAEGYSYRDEVDYEEDNSKIWHYGKAPGSDWEIIDRSPYAEMDDFAWNLYVDFHKQNGHWPDKNESRKIEELEHKVMTKMNDDINEIRKLAGLEIVAEDCDETPGEDKNDDGDCSPFTHADDNVDMVREGENCPECDGIGEVWGKPCEVCGGLGESEMDEDFLVPPKEIEDGHYEDDDDWKMQGGEDGLGPDGHGYDRDMSDTTPFHEEGPGDDEFDFDDDAMVDVGDDEDYEVFDFDDEFDAMMGNTMKYESVVEMNELRKAAGIAQVDEDKGFIRMDKWYEADPGELMSQIYWQKSQLPPPSDSPEYAENWNKVVKNLSAKFPPPEGYENPIADVAAPTACDDCGGSGRDWNDDERSCRTRKGKGKFYEEGVTEAEGDKCIRCRKGTMERGDTFFGPADKCNRCGYQLQVNESAPHGSGDYTFFNFNNEQAYYLVADEIGDSIIFGMNNEVGVPEEYAEAMVDLLVKHGFNGKDGMGLEDGADWSIAGMDEDLQNGYGNHNYADSYDDYFPRGSHQSPSTDLGPTAGELGDNPMRSPMASTDRDEVYEGMKQKYRRYRLS